MVATTTKSAPASNRAPLPALELLSLPHVRISGTTSRTPSMSPLHQKSQLSWIVPNPNVGVNLRSPTLAFTQGPRMAQNPTMPRTSLIVERSGL